MSSSQSVDLNRPPRLEVNTEKAIGVTALIVGVAAVIFATIAASGAFGGNMYFMAGATGVASIIAFCIAAYTLIDRNPAT